jgi:hypothetical protein
MVCPNLDEPGGVWMRLGTAFTVAPRVLMSAAPVLDWSQAPETHASRPSATNSLSPQGTQIVSGGAQG